MNGVCEVWRPAGSLMRGAQKTVRAGHLLKGMR